MGVPPYFDDPEKARPYFRRLRELRDAARNQFGEEILPVLSLGMSHDLEIAIEEGSTGDPESEPRSSEAGERKRINQRADHRKSWGRLVQCSRAASSQPRRNRR